MKLSKTSALAALAMVHLAEQQPEALLPARTIADHLGIPTDSALKILQTLSRRGLLHSQLGRSGGYRLLRDADEVTLLEIIEAVDGPVSHDLPIADNNSRMTDHVAALSRLCRDIGDETRDRLRAATVTDLCRDRAGVLAQVG